MRRYSSQLDRLKTFDKWTTLNGSVRKEDLAEAGFFYLGPGDTVKCFNCKVEIGNWQQGEEPKRKHIKHSPNCPCMKKFTEGNVQKPQEPQNSREATGDLVENLYKRLYSKYPFVDARHLVQERLKKYREHYPSSSTGSSAAALPAGRVQSGTEGMAEGTSKKTYSHGVSEAQSKAQQTTASARATNTATSSSTPQSKSSQGPRQPQQAFISKATEYCSNIEAIASTAKHPEYANMEARIQSYSLWQSSDIQQPRILAEAGFYFTGRDDRVRCFACDGGLCNWAREDVPWYEHSKWYGNCPYVRDCQRHPVVAAIIDAARTVDNVQSTVGCQHHHYGETQCDSENRRQGDNTQRDTGSASTETLTGAPTERSTQGQAVTDTEATIEPDLKSLQKENEELKSVRTCKLCMESPVGVIYLPCSHLVCCLDCGLQLTTCPLCRADIKATARVYV